MNIYLRLKTVWYRGTISRGATKCLKSTKLHWQYTEKVYFLILRIFAFISYSSKNCQSLIKVKNQTSKYQKVTETKKNCAVIRFLYLKKN